MAAENVRVLPYGDVGPFFCWQGASAEAERQRVAAQRGRRQRPQGPRQLQSQRPRGFGRGHAAADCARPSAEDGRAAAGMGNVGDLEPLPDQADADEELTDAVELALCASSSNSDASLSDVAGMQEEEALLQQDVNVAAAGAFSDSDFTTHVAHARMLLKQSVKQMNIVFEPVTSASARLAIMRPKAAAVAAAAAAAARCQEQEEECVLVGLLSGQVCLRFALIYRAEALCDTTQSFPSFEPFAAAIPIVIGSEQQRHLSTHLDVVKDIH